MLTGEMQVLQNAFSQKVESEHTLRQKLQDQQLKMEDVVSEAKRKIVSV